MKEGHPLPPATPDQKRINDNIRIRLTHIRGYGTSYLKLNDPEAFQEHTTEYGVTKDAVEFGSQLTADPYDDVITVTAYHSVQLSPMSSLYGATWFPAPSISHDMVPLYEINRYEDYLHSSGKLLVTTPYPAPYNVLPQVAVDVRGKVIMIGNYYVFTIDGEAMKVEHVTIDQSGGVDEVRQLREHYGDKLTLFPFEALESDSRVVPFTGHDLETVEDLIGKIESKKYLPIESVGYTARY